MVVHAFIPRTWETDTGGLLWVQGQPELKECNHVSIRQRIMFKYKYKDTNKYKNGQRWPRIFWNYLQFTRDVAQT